MASTTIFVEFCSLRQWRYGQSRNVLLWKKRYQIHHEPTFFLLSSDNERTNMAATQGAYIRSNKVRFWGINIDRRTKWRLSMKIFPNCLRFQPILRYHFGSLFSLAELNMPAPIGSSSTGSPQNKELWKSCFGYQIVTGNGPSWWSIWPNVPRFTSFLCPALSCRRYQFYVQLCVFRCSV